MGAGLTAAIEIGGKLLPSLIDAVKTLIDAGHSPAEAETIVRRDIESRLADYKIAKAADEAALERKHGR